MEARGSQPARMQCGLQLAHRVPSPAALGEMACCHSGGQRQLRGQPIEHRHGACKSCAAQDRACPLKPPLTLRDAAEAMWAANKLDIESTLRHVCRKLLNDEKVGGATRGRVRRAGGTVVGAAPLRRSDWPAETCLHAPPVLILLALSPC